MKMNNTHTQNIEAYKQYRAANAFRLLDPVIDAYLRQGFATREAAIKAFTASGQDFMHLVNISGDIIETLHN